jgi:hypothetical protein
MVHRGFLQPVKRLAGQYRTPGWIAARYGHKRIVEQYPFACEAVKIGSIHQVASIGTAMQPGMVVGDAEEYIRTGFRFLALFASTALGHQE